MKKYLLFLPFMLIGMIAINPTMAQKSPILDRDLFFGNPEISGGQLSPDGKFISFMKEYDGIMNIWVKTFDEPFEDARPLSDSKRPLYGYFWTEDGKYILYVKDKDGDENINVFAVSPAEAKKGGGIPESRNLTPLDEVTAQIYNVSQNDHDMLMIGLNDRDKAWHDLYSLRISTGELKMLYENNDRITGYDFDWDDTLRLLYRTDEKGNSTILRKEGEKLEPIYETSVTESAYASGWDKNNKNIYLITNKGDLNLSTLYLMDPASKKMKKVESDPEKRVDFGGLRIDRNTREIISTAYTDDRSRTYWKNKKWEANYNWLKEQFPGREIGFQSATNDYAQFLVSVYGDKYASESWFFNAETRELIHQYTPRPDLKEVEVHLASMVPIRYKSSDGLEIPAYLTLPAGLEAKKLPVVILVHGGPKGPRDYWGFDAEAQFLANRGYAVLQPNFRASGGFGKSFLNAGDLQWGKLMQDDITWGVKHLIDQGIADPERVAIMGGSYGGYATLAGLAFTPEVYACGVDIVGPSNIFTLLESVPAYWEAGRAFLYGMVGDPNTEEGSKLIQEASPLFSADKINKPLLIIQGANDPRVKKAEADQIVIALRDRGHDVTYLLADDEGHGFAKPVNRMAMYAEVEQFLAEKIKGRYQQEVPDDVAVRLAELKVDISTVTYAVADEVATANALPEIANRLVAGTEKWNVNVAVQGQNIPMETTRTVSHVDGKWVVEDESNGPQGKVVDEVTYNADMTALSRKVQQMGQTIEMQYHADKVAVSAMGNNIEMAYEGALLSSGAGMESIVAGMPLKEGFELVVMMPDLTTMKAKQAKITTDGTQEVDGVQYMKVYVTAVDNANERTTIWVNTETKRADKMEQVLPAMGNAVVTSSRIG
jgi:dipeptidyl aminopeptidase/acylaminoacyl peptidase